jgi:hypothetical protein
MAAGYDEKALLQQAMATSQTDEDPGFHDLQYTMVLTGMVVEHMASLSPSSPLHVYAPP